MVSRAALDAQYAMLLPCAVKAAMDEMLTMTEVVGPLALLRKSGARALAQELGASRGGTGR